MKVIKNLTKRGVAVLVAIMLCVGMLCTVAFAASSLESQAGTQCTDWHWVQVDNTIFPGSHSEYRRCSGILVWEVVEEPGCAKAGLGRLYCPVCDDNSETEDLKATFQYHDTSYLEDLGDGTHGYVCHNVVDGQECGFISHQAAHLDWTWDTEDEPTCTESVTRTRSCDTCGATETETLPATGHAWGEWRYNDQYTQIRECKNCDATETRINGGFGEFPEVTPGEPEQPEAPEMHQHEYDNYTDNGDGTHTGECNDEFCDATSGREEHQFGEWKGNGQFTQIRECEVCGATETRLNAQFGGVNPGVTEDSEDPEVPPMHTHSYTGSVTVSATCEFDGVMTYTCECGESYTETIPATGHAWSAWVVTTPATATEDGVQTRTCANCGADQTRTIPAAGIDPDDGDDDLTDIPEDDVPLAPGPAGDDDGDGDIDIPEDDVPLAPGPVGGDDDGDIDIPEDDVPLAPGPVGDDDGDGDIDIPEDDVPLADVPETGDNSGIWLVTTALSAAGLIVLVLTGKRKDEEV